MFDQRGTGAGALLCPALQTVAGASDLVVAAPAAVAGCAQQIGPKRRYFTTADTVADIETLRLALGAPKLTIDGVSYGTFVAERYALAHPDRVNRLVLDSVVPQQGVDPLYLASLQATGRVLRSVCAAAGCTTDPAADLAYVVRAHHDGPAIFNALVTESVGAPTFPGVLSALHQARAGHMAALAALIRDNRLADAVPAAYLSQGLHESTLCMDLLPPWNPNAPRADRAAALAQEAAGLRASAFYPYDQATAVGNGLAQDCLDWPPTPERATAANHDLPPVPVLLLEGQHDLSTNIAWAQQEAAMAPLHELVIVPGAGHSLQSRAEHNPAVRAALVRFLQQ
jgi:pimeloyl-ACP methyl ester carboxylesterase